MTRAKLWTEVSSLVECWHLELIPRMCPTEVMEEYVRLRRAGPYEQRPSRNIAGEAWNEKNLRPKDLSYRAKWLRNEGLGLEGAAGRDLQCVIFASLRA